jgi:CPA2 family monovalent cation:H+ antiporter-2
MTFATIEPARAWILKRSSMARRFEHRPDPMAELPMSTDQSRLTGHVVLVGYGRVGRRIADALTAQGVPFVVAEQNRELVEKLRARDISAVSGDAVQPEVLVQAHIANAGMLVIAVPDTLGARKMVEIARTLNPNVEVVLRTHSEEEAELLEKDKVGKIFMGEHELALGMTQHILGRMVRPRHG